MKNFPLISLVLLVGLFSFFCMAETDWDLAAKNIKRLQISEFSKLPSAVKLKIKKKGCKIPQAYNYTSPHNAIRGSFAAKGSQDWAILCSKNEKSFIFVIWENKQPCPSELGTSEDKNFLQGIGGDEAGYSRYLSRASAKTIRGYQESFGGALPKNLDHDGIDDIFVDKASVVYYCEDGQWKKLSGAD